MSNRLNEYSEYSAELNVFLYGLVDDGRLWVSQASYITIGEHEHPFYVWALGAHKDSQRQQVIDKFRDDIAAWVDAAGPDATLIVRWWPEFGQEEFSSTCEKFRLCARLAVADKDYKPVSPTFVPKPEGESHEYI